MLLAVLITTGVLDEVSEAEAVADDETADEAVEDALEERVDEATADELDEAVG